MEHISVPAGVFSRKKQNRFPQRNEPPSAKTKLFCRKAVPAGAGRREELGFGGLFPIWMESARVQTPFVLLQAIPLAGLTRGPDSGRTALRGGRQDVAVTGFRLSSCIPLDARGSRISVLFPSRARLHDSRRGCLDVLTKCHLGTLLLSAGLLALSRQETAGDTETGKGYDCPHWISTKPERDNKETEWESPIQHKGRGANFQCLHHAPCVVIIRTGMSLLSGHRRQPADYFLTPGQKESRKKRSTTAATPSSSFDKVMKSACCFTTSCAFAMATPKPAN